MISSRAARLRRCFLPAAIAFVVTVLPHASATPVVAPEEVWTGQFGSASDDTAFAVAATSAAIYVAGETSGVLPGQSTAGGEDAFVRKYDAEGDIVRTQQFGSASDDRALAVAATSAAIYVAGYTYGVLPGQSEAGGQFEEDAFVRRYDADGNIVWTQQFGTEHSDTVEAIAVTSTGIYVAGHTYGVLPGQSGAGRDAFVRKFDPDGNVVWTHQFGTASSDFALAIAATPAGIYVAGYAGGALPGQSGAAGRDDAFVRKYDADGNIVWTSQFGSASNDTAWAVTATPTGIYVAGTTDGVLPEQSSAGTRDAYVRRYDPDGNVVWTHQFGSASTDFASAVAATSAGIYVAGRTDGVLPDQSSSAGSDAFVRKYDAEGDIVWTHQFGSASTDLASAVAATSAGIYVAGETSGVLPGQSSAGGDDAFVRRYVSYRPDGLISLYASFDYAGKDIYNTTGGSQTMTAEVDRGNKQTFFVQAHNDGDTRDSLRVHGCKSSNGFKVTYLKGTTGTTTVTRAVVGDSYNLTKVAPGAFKTLRLVIKVTSDASPGSIKKCAISITSANRLAYEDVVRAEVEAKA